MSVAVRPWALSLLLAAAAVQAQPEGRYFSGHFEEAIPLSAGAPGPVDEAITSALTFVPAGVSPEGDNAREVLYTHSGSRTGPRVFLGDAPRPRR